MKLVYVCSPLRGDMDANIEKAHDYCRYVMACGFTPLAPHTIYTRYLDESIPEQRQRGLDMGLQLLRMSDELWVCGRAVSAGMIGEIDQARSLRLPILCVGPEHVQSGDFIRQYNDLLTASDAIPNSLTGDLRDRILVINPDHDEDLEP